MSMSPYRGAPGRPQFVCVACYHWTSPTPSVCPWCEVDLIDLGREDVREDLRGELVRRAEARLVRDETRVAVAGVSLGVAAGLLALVLTDGWWAGWDLEFTVIFALSAVVGLGAARALGWLQARWGRGRALLLPGAIEKLPLPNVLGRLGARRIP